MTRRNFASYNGSWITGERKAEIRGSKTTNSSMESDFGSSKTPSIREFYHRRLSCGSKSATDELYRRTLALSTRIVDFFEILDPVILFAEKKACDEEDPKVTV